MIYMYWTVVEFAFLACTAVSSEWTVSCVGGQLESIRHTLRFEIKDVFLPGSNRRRTKHVSDVVYCCFSVQPCMTR